MSPEKFEHIFGFQSVKGTNQSYKVRYYSSITSFLRGVAKFQGNVNTHDLSDTTPDKIEGGHTIKCSYQVYLFQDLKSTVRYYHSGITKLNHLKVNKNNSAGEGGGFKKCVFVKPNALKTYGNHMSVLGWRPYKSRHPLNWKVTTQAMMMKLLVPKTISDYNMLCSCLIEIG